MCKNCEKSVQFCIKYPYVEPMLLPPFQAQLTEDVIEISHKSYKSIILFYSRKTSRINTNSEIIIVSLIMSYPVISFKR